MSRPSLTVLPPLPPAVHLRRARTKPFPLDQPTFRLHALGRHALHRGVRAQGLHPGDEVLVPAYHHGSEVEALARAGLECRFYGRAEGLAPDEDELASLIGARTRALLLIHCIGLPQDAPRWRAWCDAHGLLLIEDAAQAWLASIDGRPAGSFGDLSIFCLYKTFGLPDGGALLMASPAPAPGAGGRGVARTIVRHVAWVRARSRLAARVGPAHRGRHYSQEADIALGDPAVGAVRATTFLLHRVADAGAAERRRRNYRSLLAALADVVPEPFARLPEGASPFIFPIASGRRSELVARLARQGIEALEFWSRAHPLVDEPAFPWVGRLRAEVTGLPVHQELRAREIERIVDAVRDAL